MHTSQRLSRIKHPRSNWATVLLIVSACSVFGLVAHTAMEQDYGLAEFKREALWLVPDTDLWALLHHLRL